MFGMFRKKKRGYQAIEPDEILIDAANLPAFDQTRLEGRIERPLGQGAFRGVFILAVLVLVVFAGQLGMLQIGGYEEYVARAEANRLSHTTIHAERGLILDRQGTPIAENAPGEEHPMRSYPLGPAAAALVGYVSYPKQDQNGYWYQEDTEGVSGIESMRNTELRGANGLQIAETNATGDVVSGSIVRSPEAGKAITLSIHAGLQKTMYDAVSRRAQESGWLGGSGAIMDIETGELLSIVSYPSFDPHVMSEGAPQEEVERLLNDSRSPFLDRAVQGVYTPGSVVKPFVALAALEEDVISPDKNILSTGSISVPNPYEPDKPTVFKDWKAHGWVDMREAIAVSSDVYFYEVGGGFQDQQGLGIALIEEYLRMFGFGKVSGVPLPGEGTGVIPNPEWKAQTFDNEPWYLGNTYHTAIGQYGFQANLMQLVRGVAAIANGGVLVSPSIEHGVSGKKERLSVSDSNLKIVREGMRQAVTDGTAAALAVPGIRVAGKTGTSEVGVRKEFINSLIIGFFPSDNPRYAFAVAMERAKAGTGQGAPAAMSEVLRWIVENEPEMAGFDPTH